MSRGFPGSTPGHGTVARYTVGCRCEGCRAAAARRKKRNSVALLMGRPGLLPYVVVTRRLHALAAIGWTYEELGARLGVTGQGVGYLAARTSGMVQRDVAQAVIRLYDELSMTPGPSSVARRRAAARGWLPPLAWDDDTIDDPNALPDVETDPELIDHIAVERAIKGDPTVLTKAERTLAVEHLAARGMCDADIGRQLGVTSATVLRDRQQHRIPSRWAAA